MAAFNRTFILQLLKVFFVLIELYFLDLEERSLSVDNHRTVVKLYSAERSQSIFELMIKA